MSAGPILTKRLTLNPHTRDDVRAQIARMTVDERAHVSPDWLARVHLAADDDPWIRGFALVDRITNVVIGTCGFKGSPDADGTVEIAYGVAPDHQGHGYATEAAEALVAYAFNSGQVRVVRAHTLAEANASARVLAKCGFRRVGEVIDPEDGPVWRWEKGLDWSDHVAGGAMPPTSVARTRFEHANPILNVADMARSLQYYVEVLGFRNAEWGGDDFTCVSRDGADIYLSEGDQGHAGTWVWIGVGDVDALHEEYKATGATILHPPEKFPWANEMKVRDPDGHVLRFGSDPKDG